jgi:hypothetical protein
VSNAYKARLAEVGRPIRYRKAANHREARRIIVAIETLSIRPERTDTRVGLLERRAAPIL